MAKKKPTANKPGEAPPAFRPELGADSPANVAAAEARGLTYDPEARVYRVSDGQAVLNRLGDDL